MLVRRCYQQLDEPLVVFMGLMFGEVVVVLGVGFGSAILGLALFGMGVMGILGVLLSLGSALGAAKLLRGLRRGVPARPLSRLYRLGLLPGFARPRHLIPLAPGPRDRGRLRLSPVEGDDEHERRFRIRYFGR
jgi:hypothetical protein